MATPTVLTEQPSATVGPDWTLEELESWAVANFEADFVSLPSYNTLEFRQKLGMEGDNLSEVLIGHIHYTHVPDLDSECLEDFQVWAGVETVMWIPEICFHVRKENAIEHMRSLVPKVALKYPFSLAAPLDSPKERENYIWPFVGYFLLAAGLVEKVPLQLNVAGQLRDFRKDFRQACEIFRKNLTETIASARPQPTGKVRIVSPPPPGRSQPSPNPNSHSLGNILGTVSHRHHYKRKREDDTPEVVKKEALQTNELLKINDEDPQPAILVPESAVVKQETAVVPATTLQQDREAFQDVRYHQQQMDRYITRMEDENESLKQELAQLPDLELAASLLPERNAMIAELQDLNDTLADELTVERESRAKETEKLHKERTHLQITVNELARHAKERDIKLNERGKDIKELRKERDSLRTEVVNLNKTNIEIREKSKEQKDAAVMEERSLRMKVERRVGDAEELLRGVPSKVARAVSVLQGPSECF